MTYLLFAVALSLSAIAAYYAVAGLIAIFAAAVVPIAIMGSLLEASKLVVASWLYRNWKEVPKLLKTYLTIALVVLMLLTSMGIFGFLSKAHLDQAIPTGDVAAKLALIDEKIKTEKENLNANRSELTQLDQHVNQTLARTDDAKGAERSIQIRRNQQKDRTRILNEIGNTQAKIAKLQEERAPIASEVRKVEAEVGPIKYIAALIYGDNNLDEGLLEKAVRIVTILIVIVFDPLAIVLLMAANWNYRKEKDLIEVEENKPWDNFFKKDPVDQFPEKESEVKKVVLQDKVVAEEHPSVKPEVTEQVDISDIEIPEITIDEHTKDWEPQLYDRKERKEIGRYMQETNKSLPKSQSFLKKVQEIFQNSEVKTIEKEVESLQNPKNS